MCEDQKRHDAFSWLDAVSSNYDYDICICDRVEASCSWILEREEYREWKFPSYVVDRPEVLWVHGKAGVGKTFLSARIVEDLQQTSSLPAAFFFATHEDSRKMEPMSILRSWIFQLASTRICAFEELHTIQTKNCGRKATDSELWTLFSSCVRKVGRCFLLVDGYDELRNDIIPRRAQVEGAREIFLKKLLQTVVGTKAHIILISRDEIDIRRQILEAHQNIAVVVRTYCVCPEDTAKDILSFSHRVISDRLKGSEASLRDEMAEKLSKHCQGMFLWVRLCGAALFPGRNAAQLRQDMSEPPNGLSEAYSRDLERISSLAEREKKRAIEILRWTLYATRPLSVIELSEAILIRTEKETLDRSDFPDIIDEDYINFQILRICGSLIEFRPGISVKSSLRFKRGTIRLTHFSIKEFLRSENRFGIRFDDYENQGKLAASCLYYLRSQEMEDFYVSYINEIMSRPAWYLLPTVPPTYKSLKRDRAFLKYSVTQWYKHVRAYEKFNGQLLPALKIFLSRENELKFRSWLCCYDIETPRLSWSCDGPVDVLRVIANLGLTTAVKYFGEDRKINLDSEYTMKYFTSEMTLDETTDIMLDLLDYKFDDDDSLVAYRKSVRRCYTSLEQGFSVKD